ncbi:MAG TPA: HAD-IA family hydrolase [Nitrospiraceae bacterium]|jgi:putative hydrolase of the HAD superfamily
MKTSIQVIFFDAAETLFHIKGSVADIYLTYAVRHGFRQSSDSHILLAQAFQRAFHDASPPVFAATDPIKLKQCERLWWFDIVHNVFYRVGMFDRFDEFFDQVFQVFEDPRSWVLYPETLPVLTRLREEGFELGIVSNFDSRLFPVMRGLGIDGFFDTITIASLAKAAKPASKIFEIALEKHSMDPGEAMHVGDSIRDDVEGATKAGLTGVLLDRTGRVQASEGVVIIRTLAELLPLVGY